MPSTLQEAVRERVTLRSVVSLVVAMAILRVAVDASVPQLAVTAVLSLVTGAAGIVRDVYDVRQSVTGAWVGAVSVVGSATLFALGEGPVWFSAAFLAVGAWFLADAVQTARHEGLTEDEPSGREVYRNYVGRRVHETLEDGPHTRRELFDALAADDETVEAALERLRERGVVVREGSEFRLDSGEKSRLDRVRDRLAGLGRRIARPVTLELGPEDESGERGGSTPPRDGPVESGSNRREHTPDSERERERESAD